MILAIDTNAKSKKKYSTPNLRNHGITIVIRSVAIHENNS